MIGATGFSAHTGDLPIHVEMRLEEVVVPPHNAENWRRDLWGLFENVDRVPVLVI